MGEAPARNVVVLPVLFEGETKAVIELCIDQRVRTELPELPRPADGFDRGHDQHDLLQHAYGRTSTAAQEVERGTRGSSRRAQRQGQAPSGQEHGSRDGQPKPGGEGRAAAADLQVQVRVPGQHVSRAADTAQQPVDPLADAGGKPRRQSHPGAGEVRPDRVHFRGRLALADQRDPGSLQGRSWQDADRPAPRRAGRRARISRTDLSTRGTSRGG